MVYFERKFGTGFEEVLKLKITRPSMRDLIHEEYEKSDKFMSKREWLKYKKDLDEDYLCTHYMQVNYIEERFHILKDMISEEVVEIGVNDNVTI